MRLIDKLRCLFSSECDDPEIVEDMYVPGCEPIKGLETFYAELGRTTKCRGICYFDAFVEHISCANVDVSSRSAVEQYLYRIGMGAADVKQLTDEFFKVDK